MRSVVRHSILLLVLLAVNTSPFAWAREQPAFIEELLQGDDAIEVTGTDRKMSPVVTLGKRFGGSGVSLYYRGVEYVNNDNGKEVDYGRQLQSAVQYRDVNECFNPTEAGGKYDRGRPMSSSRLLLIEQPQPNVVITQTDMAFWMAPNEEKTKKGKECTALNTDYRAGYILKRKLQVGVEGYPNVISYQTQFLAPKAEPNPRYEPVVIHTPRTFSRVFRVAKDGREQELIDIKNERGGDPYMLTTSDFRHAVLICTSTQIGKGFYGHTRHGDIIASRFIYFGDSQEKESQVFDNYVIVGSPTEVREGAAKFCFVR